MHHCMSDLVIKEFINRDNNIGYLATNIYTYIY